MAYEKAKDSFAGERGKQDLFGNSGKAIVKSDTEDMAKYAKAIVVTAVGTLKILPVKNEDADTIDFGSVPIGFIPPYRVRRVFSTGTTASVATIED